MRKLPQKALYRIAVKGGIISPGELLRIIELARSLGQNALHFGSRQDILLSCPEPNAAASTRFGDIVLEPIKSSLYSNIVCSYVSADIFGKTPWLTSSSYLYILEQFNYRPKLEVNITDPRQRLTPLFSGHLNFIASVREDYWYLYVRLPSWKENVVFPALIHSWELAEVAEALNELPDLETIDEVVQVVNKGRDLKLRNIEEDLVIPFYPFPYYEGMNRLDAAHYWLGLYWRNNGYDLNFLEATCRLCLEHRIGKICVTTWKSLIINGIPTEKRIEWEKLLGRFGINARHSSLELNWHLPVADDDALKLKTYLVRAFDQRDISTYGLTFGVSSPYSRPFTSIIIDSERPAGVIDGYAVRPTYNVRYARNFDPNTREYIEYARQVDKSELVELMVELSRLYFEQLNDRSTEVVGASPEKKPADSTLSVLQCKNCQTIYDPALGDPENGIAPNTAVSSLPIDYSCWTCGSSLAEFEEVELVLD